MLLKWLLSEVWGLRGCEYILRTVVEGQCGSGCGEYCTRMRNDRIVWSREKTQVVACE